MRIISAVAIALAAATPVLAQNAPLLLKQGVMLRDANKARLGKIDRVNPDGSVQLIYRSKFVTIPAEKIVVSEDGVTTSLSRQEVAGLN